MNRRSKGEGTIFQRKDGRYSAALTLENHKRVYFYGKTKKEVREKLQEAQMDNHRGMLATGPQRTVREHFEHWLEKVQKSRLRVSTYLSYRGRLDNQILPALGDIRLQKLTLEKVEAFYQGLLDGGCSPSTLHVVHVVLHSGLANAVKRGLVSRNVADSVTLPMIKPLEMLVLTLDQVHLLLKTAAASRGYNYEYLLTIAFATGMRRGELLALRWQDVDLEKGWLQVRRTVDRKVGGFVENEPKTASSRRRITLPDFAQEALKKQWEYQETLRSRAGDAWEEHGLVFSNTMGRYIVPNHMHYLFKLSS